MSNVFILHSECIVVLNINSAYYLMPILSSIASLFYDFFFGLEIAMKANDGKKFLSYTLN